MGDSRPSRVGEEARGKKHQHSATHEVQDAVAHACEKISAREGWKDKRGSVKLNQDGEERRRKPSANLGFSSCPCRARRHNGWAIGSGGWGGTLVTMVADFPLPWASSNVWVDAFLADGVFSWSRDVEQGGGECRSGCVVRRGWHSHTHTHKYPHTREKVREREKDAADIACLVIVRGVGSGCMICACTSSRATAAARPSILDTRKGQKDRSISGSGTSTAQCPCTLSIFVGTLGTGTRRCGKRRWWWWRRSLGCSRR